MNEHLWIAWCQPSGGRGFGVSGVRQAAGFSDGVGAGEGSKKKPRGE